MSPDRLLHLDLLIVAFLLVQLGPQPGQILRVFGDFVGFAGGAFAEALFVVESGAGNTLVVCSGY